MPTALLSFLHAAAFEDGYDHGVDLVLDSISSSAVRRKASAAFLGGDWTQSRMPAVRTAFTKLPEKEQTPEGEEKGIICGVATGDGHSDGRITCGIPMYREHQSGAPFILPLYMQPAATTGGGGGGGGGGGASTVEAAISGRLRQEALMLMKRFLDVAPPEAPALPGGGGMYYPVPDKKTPGGIAIVSNGTAVPLPPDLGPSLPKFGNYQPTSGEVPVMGAGANM
mmetsp:Transcript_83717/g.147756  ORF Transcript_83717/g.147756 Transcript_83717/m.147756 type:complete len:225 (-) Transcript_83717:63-737(-)